MRTGSYSESELINKVAKDLVKAGWESKVCKKHPRLRNPATGQVITIPKTPSDHRSALNWISQIRRAGVEVPKCC